MTICVAIKVHDCTVFAADSATSLQGLDAKGSPIILKVFQHGNKVFNMYKGLPICAMTCGMGNIGESSISTLAKDLRAELAQPTSAYYIDPKNYTMKDVADRVFNFFFADKYTNLSPKPAGDHSFEFWVGGYGSTGNASEVWRIQILNGQCPGPSEMMNASMIGVQASGQPDAINRLVVGYSQHLPDALVSVGLKTADLPKVLAAINTKTQATVVYPSMPVQDAIRLAEFLVDVTKGFVSFIPGADTVGGSTDVAVVTKHEGFKWIKRKHYYSSELNPLETDHV